MSEGETEEEGGERATPPSLEVETLNLDTETAERFTNAVTGAVEVFRGLARIYGVELPELLVVGTLDFQASVHDLLQQLHGPDQPAYTTERLGGTAIAKNIPMNEDYSKIAIVMSAHPWAPGEESRGLAIGLFLLGHELTHAVLARLRVLSGALDGVTFPSTTPRLAARSITRIAVDEVRADRVADIVLSQSVTKTVEGEEVRVNITDAELLGPTPYRDALAVLLVTRVYPGWRDAVNEYRNFGVTLEDLMRKLIEETDQVMTCVGHAEAEAQSTPESADLFVPPASAGPGATWLIGPVWKAIRTVSIEHPLVPALSDFKAAELAILDEGERELFAMWERLGITFDPLRPDSHPYRIDVDEPAEPPESGSDHDENEN